MKKTKDEYENELADSGYDPEVVHKRITSLFKGMSQTAIAKKLNLSQAFISTIISGKVKAPASYPIYIIAKKFNVSADWLLGISDCKSTDKATKSVCKTLGLSDEAVNFAMNEKNHRIMKAVSYLIEQNIKSETEWNKSLSDPEYTIPEVDLYSILQDVSILLDLSERSHDILIYGDDNNIYIEYKKPKEFSQHSDSSGTDKYVFKASKINSYFPLSYTQAEMECSIHRITEELRKICNTTIAQKYLNFNSVYQDDPDPIVIEEIDRVIEKYDLMNKEEKKNGKHKTEKE